MKDILAIKRKTVVNADFDRDRELKSYLNNSCVPNIDEESYALIAPLQQDGTYHSDMASADKQPQLLQRVKQLPKSFSPRGFDDEDIINACGSRSLHDIADINNVSENVLDNVPRTATQLQGASLDRENNSNSSASSVSNNDSSGNV